MAKHSLLTSARLREIASYNPKTGEFMSQPIRIGWNCGGKQRRPYPYIYRIVAIDGKNYLEHRLAWFWMTGEWPPSDAVIDHINGDSTDNRWENLRLATLSQNQRNRTRMNKNNPNGLTGAYRRSDKRWVSWLGKRYLGTFATKEEAHEAYRKAALEKYGEFAPKRLSD
jgi:hypothetical protein